MDLPCLARSEQEDGTGPLPDDGSGHSQLIALQMAVPAKSNEIGVMVMGVARDLRPWFPYREREV